MEVIKNLSEIARTLMESEAKYDSDICKMTVLFPLLETLGYDATKAGDIILNPAYMQNGEYKLDYGLRGDSDDSVKTMIKMIELDAEPGLEFSNIRQCIMPGDTVEYIVITDCFNYYVYANVDGGITFLDVVSFNICNVNATQIRSFNVLRNPTVSQKQDYALHSEAEEPETTVPAKYIKAPKPTKASVKKKLWNNTMTIITASLCIIIILSAVLFAFMEKTNLENWYKLNMAHDDVSLTYYTLKGNVSLSTYEDKLGYLKLSITQTNLPAGTNVSLKLENSAGLTLKTNALVDSSGCIIMDIPIATTWKNTDITVTASVVFDAHQTAEAKEKYGEYGQKIVSLTGNKELIGSASTYYDYDRIDAFIKDRDQQAAEAELAAIRKYFSNYTVVQYANGDMAFYPKGYNTDDWDYVNKNITSTNKSYAKIYYNAATKTGTFYYIAGTFMKSASWIVGEVILSDTVNTYKMTGNVLFSINDYSSVTGWCRFDQAGVSSLIPILSQVYSSNSATIEFKDLHKVSISQADKDAVLSIIDLYTKYFSNGNISLNPEWFRQP